MVNYVELMSMKLLKEIMDKNWPQDKSTLDIRRAVRAVLFDDEKLIPMLYVAKYKYHKLPGGGIKKGEGRNKALIREVLEEVGSEIEVGDEVGKVVEFRSKWNLRQVTCCYTGKIVSKGTTSFTKKELNQGFELVWMLLEVAINKVRNDKPTNYEGRFVQQRDLIFLEEVKAIK